MTSTSKLTRLHPTFGAFLTQKNTVVYAQAASLFGSTYPCESAFSDMNFIKNKHRTCFSDAHLQDSLRVAVSKYTPDYNTLVNSMRCQSSHWQRNRYQVLSLATWQWHGKVEFKYWKTVFYSKVKSVFMKCNRYNNFILNTSDLFISSKCDEFLKILNFFC